MGEGWQLLKIRGIPLRIHPTWFVILLLATLAFEQQYRTTLPVPVPPLNLWGVALATALLLFVSVLLHELGHSVVALSQGVKVRSITLFLLGGVANVERDCSTALGALAVALAGPLVSFALAVLLLAGVHPLAHQSPLLGEMVTRLGMINLVLALFNLLPGLPLDGGLVVKALVWQVTGSHRRGVEVANSCGQFLSFLAIGLGTVLLLRGAAGSGAWLMLLGWFGLGAARNQRQLLQVQKALRDTPVRQASRRRFRVVEASTTLRQLSRLEPLPSAGAPLTGAPEGSLEPARNPSRPANPSRMAWGRSGAAASASAPAPLSAPGGLLQAPDWILVCDRGRWRGVIDEAVLQALPVQRWDNEIVGNHLRPLSDLPSISESAPLWQAVLRLEEASPPRLLVLSPAGLPTGTLEKPEVGEAVLQAIGLRLPPPLLAAARQQNSYPLGLRLSDVARSMLASGEVRPAPEPAAASSQPTA